MTPPPPPQLAQTWIALIRPALIIGFIGACAVFYLASCARLSVIECDLRRLERTAQDEQARELDLRREIAQLHNAEQVRAHIVKRGLCRPVALVEVRLTDVSPELARALPARNDAEAREVMIGQLPSDDRELLIHSAASTP